MASISTDKDGNRIILFMNSQEQRKTIYLGKATMKEAQTFKTKIERILGAQLANTEVDSETSRWLGELPDKMHKRFLKKGLTTPRKSKEILTLSVLLKRFDDSAVVKASTHAAYAQTFKSLKTHFPDDPAVSSITARDADNWRADMSEVKEGKKTLATATISKRVHIAKTIFRKAVRWGVVAANPFAELRAGSQCNPERGFYVSPEVIQTVLAACPNDEWKAIVALSRFAGLRCPSEITLLRWGDICWDKASMTIRSPKTEGHGADHAIRIVPISPELRPILEKLFLDAEPGTEAVVPRLRCPKMNLRTTLYKIIARAGLKPWPRLFHNLRASCATDWCDTFPGHVVAGWLGHSPLISAKHYLTTKDAHFNLAAGMGAKKTSAESRALPAQSTAQRPTSQEFAGSRNDQKVPSFVGNSQSGEKPRNMAASETMGATGIEPLQFPAGNSEDSSETRAEYRASGGDSTQKPESAILADPDLTAVVAAWSDLPTAVRLGIAAMVKAAIYAGGRSSQDHRCS